MTELQKRYRNVKEGKIHNVLLARHEIMFVCVCIYV